MSIQSSLRGKYRTTVTMTIRTLLLKNLITRILFSDALLELILSLQLIYLMCYMVGHALCGGTLVDSVYAFGLTVTKDLAYNF